MVFAFVQYVYQSFPTSIQSLIVPLLCFNRQSLKLFNSMTIGENLNSAKIHEFFFRYRCISETR